MLSAAHRSDVAVLGLDPVVVVVASPSDLSRTQSWLYVDDASIGIQRVCERGKIGEIYNLGTYFEKNVADLAHVIQAEVDRQLGREVSSPRFVSIPDRPYNDMRYLIDISKAEKELGWTPQISFEEGGQFSLIVYRR
ncbi:hypothetical protein ANCCEY_14920 [Ancylostoma ceylanicum]|uniref:NAD(P)-binding domain-containing protein n=1 Tax=Ancylostoma ceylanicum TaxID=53326 RepID=A0A0D6LEA5_9BILA|nr:hypothetical protein ANCCEY_14920 [Ancylostoma ceylanicum]